MTSTSSNDEQSKCGNIGHCTTTVYKTEVVMQHCCCLAMPTEYIPKRIITLGVLPRELLATQVYPPVKLLVRALIVSVLDIVSDEMLNLLFGVMTRF